MKFLIIATCILFVCNYCKLSYFLVLGIREPRILFSKKYSFLYPNHRRILKNLQIGNNVYNFLRDSCEKNLSLYSNYSEYLRDNQTVQKEPKQKSLKNILAVETSFDDTCVAVVRSDGEILSDKKSAQEEIIEEFGGIKPSSARLAHINEIEMLSDKVIKESGLKISDIDEIAVTRGPGTELCLRVGYNYAKDLSKKYNIPLVSENHIAGHCLSPLIDRHQFVYSVDGTAVESKNLKFPYLCLLLSGGHSQIYLVENPSKFYLICDTLDEYAGNVLDKCAKVLGLDVSKGGGAQLEKTADEVKSSRFNFTIPNKKSHYMEFCFSGVQSQLTAVTRNLLKNYKVEDPRSLPGKLLNELAFGAQSTVFESILAQLEMAINVVETLFPINKLALVGGVACNEKLKKMILDMFYLRDHSVRYSNQENLYLRTKQLIKKYLKSGGNFFIGDNPYAKYYEDFSKKISGLKEFIYYLWNPEVYPEILMPGYISKVGKEHKSELYKTLLCTYFNLIGPKKVMKIDRNINRALHRSFLVKPSVRILKFIQSDSKFTLPLGFGLPKPNTSWHLFSTSKNYCTDNAVMIAFSLIQKNRMGMSGVKNQDKIDGRDVVPRWDLGARKNWELVADICKLDSLLHF